MKKEEVIYSNAVSSSEITKTRKWIICAAVCINNFIVDGMMSFPTAVLFSALVRNYPDQPRGMIALIPSLSHAVMTITAPLSASLCEILSSRAICIIGSLFCVTGTISSSYVSSIQQMFVTFSVIFGVGFSLIFTSGQVILGKHFTTNLGFAAGICSSGTAAGSIAFAVILDAIYTNLGLRTGFLVQGALVAIPLFTACSFVPATKVVTNQAGRKKKKKVFFDWTIFRSKALIMYYICICVCFFGFLVPRIFLVRYAVDIGVDEKRAAWLAGISSAGSLIGRITVARITKYEWFNTINAHQLSFLLTACSLTLLPVAPSYSLLAVLSFTAGFGESGYIVNVLVVCKELAGSKFTYAFGMLQLVLTIPTVVGPYVTGLLYDLTKSYTVTCFSGGTLMFIGILLMFVIPWLNNAADDKRDPSELTTDYIEDVLIHEEVLTENGIKCNRNKNILLFGAGDSDNDSVNGSNSINSSLNTDDVDDDSSKHIIANSALTCPLANLEKEMMSTRTENVYKEFSPWIRKSQIFITVSPNTFSGEECHNV